MKIGTAELPHVLYRFYDAEGRLLYIGIAVDFLIRWRKHRKKQWWPQVARMEIVHYPNRVAALAAERTAIVAERPRHNRQHNKLVLTEGELSLGVPERIQSLWSHLVDAPWSAIPPPVRRLRLIALSLWLAGFWPVSVIAFGIGGNLGGSMDWAWAAGLGGLLTVMAPWWLIALNMLSLRVSRQ